MLAGNAVAKDLGKNERYHIYIGLNDKEKLKQMCSTEDFIRMVSNDCKDYRIAFSMNEQKGGYMMADGIYAVENSLDLSIVGLNREEIFRLAAELRLKLNQESILVTCDAPEVFLIAK